MLFKFMIFELLVYTKKAIEKDILQSTVSQPWVREKSQGIRLIFIS